MSNHPNVSTWTVGALAAVLLLGACSGGSDKPAEKTKGAHARSKSGTPSAADGVKRPEIKLAKDAENVFEDMETGDPNKDAILSGTALKECSPLARGCSAEHSELEDPSVVFPAGVGLY